MFDNNTTSTRRRPWQEDDLTYELQWMFDAIQSPGDGVGSGPVLGGLPAVKELDLDISQWEERERSEIKRAIRQCVKGCGSSLDVWKGTLPSCEDECRGPGVVREVDSHPYYCKDDPSKWP